MDCKNNYSPCLGAETLFDCDDYDPCEMSDDITEKDLAILLKEEKAKLKAKLDCLEQDNDVVNTTSKTNQMKEKTGRKIDNNPEDSEDVKKSNDVAEERGEDKKKKPCKKVIKNPFFTNRLGFSTDLPPPPPHPPPQFYPPVDEDGSKTKICPKRKKKCKKKTDQGKDRFGTGNDTANDDDDGGKGKDDKTKLDIEPADDVADVVCDCDDEGKDIGADKDDTERLYERDSEDRGKRKKGGCRKTKDRPPCRKKESEISITMPPRQIPARQRDLPPTCPKDIPEVERQIMMARANDCRVDCIKNKCKKKTST